MPSLSDIDVLIVTDYVKTAEDMAKTTVYINEKVFNMDIHPFEFHFSTTRLYEEWYKDMIDKNVRIC